ncbi:MAG: rRNA pseudouridine synthase [Paenibacillaceae bacterium]|nr:rRNA pseudouridine synthase [Paenibacillaceae bacterium]
MKRTMRLDKLLAHTGFGSRSEIKLAVKRGAVTVNGRTVKDSGLQVDPERDDIVVDGEPAIYREFVYLMLNKPPGVVSATEDNRDRTVIDLVADQYGHMELFPVGRLDKDTEGLLLLTNDGKLAHRLLSPKKHVPKTYYAEVEGSVGEDDAKAFSAGVDIGDGYVTMPATLRVLDTPTATGLSRVELAIMEGKFHQVKRMFQAVGKKVVYLQRIAMGPLELDKELALGAYRELDEGELALLKGEEES